MKFLKKVFRKKGQRAFSEGTSTEDRITNLIELSLNTAINQPEDFHDLNEIVNQSIELTAKAQSFCCRYIIRDLTQKGLLSRKHSLAEWRLDFVKPDRYHVTQVFLADTGAEPMEEWVTIGKGNYRNTGLWIRTEDGMKDEVNTMILGKGYLNTLRDDTPFSSSAYLYGKERYLLLEYELSSSGEFYESFKACTQLLDKHCQVNLWIDLESGYLAKGELTMQGKEPEGEYIHSEYIHVFTCYNDKIKVNPPPWLNAVPKPDGTFEIVNTKIPELPHH